jgi:F-type H+-transporting ATPase subunit epsilon
MTKMKLQIVSLDRTIVSQDIDSLIVSADGGMMGILPDHAPLMADLKIGELYFTNDNVREEVAVMGGVMRVKDNQVLILTPDAERAKEIDVLKAEKDRERAQLMLINKDVEKTGMVEAQNLLTKSMTRLRIARKRA